MREKNCYYDWTEEVQIVVNGDAVHGQADNGNSFSGSRLK
jgi:hypothetical protein